MKVLNRGFIIVSPKPIFIREALGNLEADILTPDHPEPSIYLIEEDFWDDAIVLKKYLKCILNAEIKQLDYENESFLSKIKFDNIHDFFNISMGSLVFDLDERPIERLTDD
ncbi:MAG: hypothetical protein P8K10_00020 [Crocinitomicaceae bacterium]|nr:hypothetical protein [Crocinitomicaceae bacterium]